MENKEQTLIPVDGLIFAEQGEKLPVYSELYEIGYPMPPICVCKRGMRYEILDGNKRGRSAIAAGCKMINAVIY